MIGGSFRNDRSIAYVQYTAWVHHYELLGRGNRVVLQACVISRIRGEFLSPNDDYTGFKEFLNIDV